MSFERLTLIEQPYLDMPHPLAKRLLLATGATIARASVVVGIELRERPDVYLVGYQPTGIEKRRELQLISSHARRWEEFYNAHFGSVANHAHDDEAIVRYMLGMSKIVMHNGPPWPPIDYEETDSEITKHGTGYALLDNQSQPMHLLYGIGEPNLAISSPKAGRPPIVAPIDSFMELYGSHNLSEISPERNPSQFRL